MTQPVMTSSAESLPLAGGLQGVVADLSSDQRAFKNVELVRGKIAQRKRTARQGRCGNETHGIDVVR